MSLDSAELSAAAEKYFEDARTITIVSPTAACQRWPVPGTEDYLPAEQAREISLSVRQRLGSTVL